MKLFIAMPMRNRKSEEIEALMEKYHRLCENVIFDDEELLLIKSYDAKRHFGNPVAALAESLRLLCTADFVFFAPGWEDARSCRIEQAVCEAYGIYWYDGNELRGYLANDTENVPLWECPHCGADGGFLARKTETSAENGKSIHYIMCCNCGARSGRTGNRLSADAEWNRRVADENAVLAAVDVRMEDSDRRGDTESTKELYSYEKHKEELQEVVEILSKEILSRVRECAADENTLNLIHAHREIMESMDLLSDYD